ncbi:MAG: hypothetical protein Q9162_002553 [Coniocarpon cinnabarinum]
MNPAESARWHAHLQSPILINNHEPVEVASHSIRRVDLNPLRSTPQAVERGERVLLLTPLKDASYYFHHYFELLRELTYPHELIDLGFLVGDSSDETRAILAKELDRLQGDDKVAFRSALIIERDFGSMLPQDVASRHGYAAQAPRRKMLGRVRNYLLASALKPEHSWVYWRDLDIQEAPATIIEDLIAHDRDVIVPNVWFHRWYLPDGTKTDYDIEGRFDYNSWVESTHALRLAESLPKDVVIAEGYREFETKRTYMCKMGNYTLDQDEEMELDGIGGVSIMVKADVHRSGVNFPAYAFENQAETEGFAKMAKRAGYGVFGLPNYVIWHIDTDEKPGNV